MLGVQVERNVDRKALLTRLALQGQGLVDLGEQQRIQQAGTLKLRQERYGRQHPTKRVIPAHQHFHATDRAAQQVDFRLVVGLELTIVQGVAHFVGTDWRRCWRRHSLFAGTDQVFFQQLAQRLRMQGFTDIPQQPEPRQRHDLPHRAAQIRRQRAADDD